MMTDNYMPDTDRIRLVFKMGGADDTARQARESVFDQWLAAHDAELLENARTTLEEDRLYMQRERSRVIRDMLHFPALPDPVREYLAAYLDAVVADENGA